MFKNKLVLLSPIIALAVIFIFSLTLFPSVQPQPKNLPIAIVNEDEGVQIPNQPEMNMGKTIVEAMQKNSKATTDEDTAVKWVEVITAEEAQKGMDNQKYYAALVIPKDFSAKQASLRTQAPSSPEVQIYINQGMNTAASTMAGQVLNGVVDNMNNKIRTQLLDGFEKQGAPLTAKQAASLATPISKKVTNVNEIGTNSASGNSPVSLFQPLWIGSLAGAAIIFIAVSKLSITNRKENLIAKIGQILIGVVVSLVVGFGLTWLAGDMVGLHIPQFTDTALFLSITSFCFFLMISAVLSWLGIRSIGIFALLLFFGAPLLSMAPEMMSPFYRDWIYSWLPMRFMIQGLRDLFFFGKGLTWSSSVSTLVWIGAVSMVIILASALKLNSIKYKTQNQN
ncbi:YhgE/Pip N-terminal domain-containing protein [Bacillus sp. OV166]|uniref:YhgE/Pip domain-containing protein n=1 Tax=Bacillus sp. OV166 TaxID=1882763 RepID=UPI000A2AE213|nr:ABC transporter permease [Bacillus sp. OV166]SMQ77606.1 YhgE/Pip N-terminal domain-containing protein [Bacillus sp. OV166]